MSTNGNQLTEFINYLLDFGFLSKINVDDFTKIFNISQINEFSFFDFCKNLLFIELIFFKFEVDELSFILL